MGEPICFTTIVLAILRVPYASAGSAASAAVASAAGASSA